MSFDSSAPGSSAPGPTPRALRIGGVILALIALGIVIYGVSARARSDKDLRQWTDNQAVPSVKLVSPSADNSSKPLELPGRLEAYTRAPIYARVSGYLKSWKVDIGTHVKAGQLLGEIETPDLDQQLLQGRADLASAQANVGLAATTAKRWQAMLETDSVSRQEVDDRNGDLATKQALVQAAQANVDRLLALKSFSRITAPFDGVVTARDTDIGALINVGSGVGPALFVVSDIVKLRLYVNVPQNYVSSLQTGHTATITVPEHAGKSYTAAIVSSAQSVDVNSGTMLMQLSVDNSAGELTPGGFARISFNLDGSASALSIPASALIVDQSGLHVATVTDANSAGEAKVQLKPVTIARDMGKIIALSSGVTASDRIIDSPPDGIAEGQLVRISPPEKTNQPETAGQAKSEK